MSLPKPKSVEANEFKSQKWDELTSGRDFPESAIPQLALLCHWYAVAEQCMEDVTYDDRIQIAYSNEHDDMKALPHHAKLKEASAEIRAINKQLGIVDQLQTERLNTSQNVTAPKQAINSATLRSSLNTSQNVTAPKLV